MYCCVNFPHSAVKQSTFLSFPFFYLLFCVVCSCPWVTYAPTSSPSRLTGTLSWTWVELFLVYHLCPGVNRHLLMSSQKPSIINTLSFCFPSAILGFIALCSISGALGITDLSLYFHLTAGSVIEGQLHDFVLFLFVCLLRKGYVVYTRLALGTFHVA